MRNFQKAIEDGRKLADKRTGLDISCAEIHSLYYPILCAARGDGVNGNEIVEAICNAYLAGLAIGHRNR